MKQDLIDEAFHVAARMAFDRSMDIDREALLRALLVVTRERDGRENPEEIAEDALDLLGDALGAASSRGAGKAN
ncbi:hypothetical protein ACNHKD_16545 [Methylocystis sp. JAN1]|uniref:hypothetical protein n=1 Tax=Methylocystis sp. JAN1 TaxID=3397211 RepID=UPI003FA268F2